MKTLAEMRLELELGLSVYQSGGPCLVQRGTLGGYWWGSPCFDKFFETFEQMLEHLEEASSPIWSTYCSVSEDDVRRQAEEGCEVKQMAPIIDFKTRQVLAEMPQQMKTLAELKDDVLAGRHVCAPDGNGGTTYVFRERRSGSIVEAYGHAPGKFTVYADMRLVREDEPGYDPSDYANLLTNASGPALHPVWQICVIPDALMKQFLQDANVQIDMHRKMIAFAFDALEREGETVRIAAHAIDNSLLTLTIGEARNGNQQVYRDISLSEILRLAPALHPYAGTIQQRGCLEVEVDSIKYGVYPF
jgi:hypothetical protein